MQAFHQTRISQSAKLVEDELWVPTEITPGLQHVANVIIDSAVRDPSELIIKSEDVIFSPYATSFPSPVLNGDPPTAQTLQSTIHCSSISNGAIRGLTTPPTKPVSSKHLRIDERAYYAVAATTEVIMLIMDYLRVVVNLSMLTTDTMSRIIEFLKAFNSRTCQVVLGAGAMRSAGLKNITAKHLGRSFVETLSSSMTKFLPSLFFISPCVAIAFDCFRIHSLHPGSFQEAFKPEAGCHVSRI